MPNPTESANAVINTIASKTDSVILMCSLGKDSLVTLDMIYGRFRRIVCVFMYFVPGLEHIERWVRWVKKRYHLVEFVQIPHWNLSYMLRSGVCCVRRPDIKLIKLADVIKSLRLRYGIEYVFLGMKRADGMNRNLMLKGYAAKGYENNGLVYPLAEWTQKHVISYMRQHSMPEPVRYSLKASSGVGLNLACLTWLEQNCPGDLQKIYQTFPLAERILWEQKHKLS